MPIIEKTGNLLKSGADILVDLNNCAGVSGAGLAKAFKEELPNHFKLYQSFCLSPHQTKLQLGEARVCLVEHYKVDGKSVKDKNDNFVEVPRTVVMTTKDHWRDDSRLEVVLWGVLALKDIIEATNRKTRPVFLSVALAHPGCGNGGLSKDQVRPLIDQHLGNLPNEIFLY